MDLLEVAHMWRSDCHIMAKFDEAAVERPNDFLSKFLSNR